MCGNPEEFRRTRFEAIPDEVRQMIQMEDKGVSRTEIAKKLGVSKSQVSRSLRAQGRRKKPRKPTDSKRLMSWHSTGSGWVKCYKSERYYVGLGTLKKLYPRLVKEKSEEGSWRAANRWWQEKPAELQGKAPATVKR